MTSASTLKKTVKKKEYINPNERKNRKKINIKVKIKERNRKNGGKTVKSEAGSMKSVKLISL